MSSFARGTFGEQEAGFYFGKQGYFIVDGPGGAKGHQANERGFDGIAFNPKTRILVIYDNKAYTTSTTVHSTTAIDDNLIRNLNTKIQHVKQMADFPFKAEIIDRMQKLLGSVTSQRPLPKGVVLAVINAGGIVTRVSEKLKKFQFIDYNSDISISTGATQPRKRPARGFLIGGDMIMNFITSWLTDYAIQRRVKMELEQKTPRINEFLLLGKGVLVIVELIEWKMPDFNGNRARSFFRLYIFPGSDKQSAIDSWYATPRLMAAPPKGWRKIKDQHHWISTVTFPN